MSVFRLLICRGCAVAAVACCALAFGGASASAFAPISYLSSFGPGGPGSGTFSEVGSVAVDQSTGDVYVLDRGAEKLYKFNSVGEPQEFSALKADAISGPFNTGFPASDQGVAIDSSTGPAKGDIYVSLAEEMLVYSESGEPRGIINSEFEKFGGVWGYFACGGTVDPAGNVYIGMPEHVAKFTPVPSPPAEFPVGNANYTGEIHATESASCGLAVDAQENVYTTSLGGEVLKYTKSQFHPVEEPVAGTLVNGIGPTLAVDPSGGAAGSDLYLDEESDVAQFDSKGKLIEKFAESGAGGIAESYGVAVDGASKDVYVSNGTAKTVEIFAPVTLPEPLTSSVSGLGSRNVTLTGSVNTKETTLTSCEFEYGTEVSYGFQVPCASVPPPGEGFVPVKSGLVGGLEPDMLYHYRLAVSAEGHTLDGEDETFTTLKAPPTLARAAFASAVGQYGATLNASVDPEGILGSYHFEYGPSTGYGSDAPSPDGYVPVNRVADSVSEVVEGLLPGTTYHFAVVANSPGGPTVGPDETFTTLPLPAPSVTTGGASEVSVGAATLSGSVDPQGGQTGYHFEYGPSTGYGSRWPSVDIELGAFSGSQGVVTFLQNLLPGTLYHYRLVASNPAGTSYGADGTLTTQAYPASVVQETPELSGAFGVNPETVHSPGAPAKHKARHKAKRKSGRRAKGRRKGRKR